MSHAIITAEHVSKWYGQVIGLNDVTVSVPPGITGLDQYVRYEFYVPLMMWPRFMTDRKVAPFDTR